MNKAKPIRAAAMLSGGLDSTLAIRIMQEQDIHITALHFKTGFSYTARDRAVKGIEEPTAAEKAAAILDVPLVTRDVSKDFLPVVLEPRYGYGSGMNPCVDCRIFLLRQAKAWMEAHAFDFVFTGEVVGQRPKSQMRPSLRTVERESGLQGYLVRPLSAKLLRVTVPEERGWIDRQRLLGISGRGRKEQIALAERFGIVEYPQPSGGCCTLIDRTYSRRLRDFLEHEGSEALTGPHVQILAVGRHLRLPSGQKVVVGRHEKENAFLGSLAALGPLLTTIDHPGPTTILPGQPTWDDIVSAARITASYSDGKEESLVRVAVKRHEHSQVMDTTPESREAIKGWMV